MSSTNPAPSLFGVPLKLISLVTNSSLILVMHYSRIMPGYDANSRYYASTAVLLNEIIKLVVCSAVSVHSLGFRGAYNEAFSADCWKLALPASLYTLQNTLQYVAVSNLDAATFQVTYQMKILTTAFFAVTMLHRRLNKFQWLSLFLLTLGIALVQIPADAFKELIAYFGSSGLEAAAAKNSQAQGQAQAQAQKAAAGHGHEQMNGFLGLIAVSVACILSGLAGIYFEKVLKGSKVTLWSRNVQLSFFSLFPAFFFGVLAKDGANIRENGFFHGYNGVVWTAIFLQAFGGIVVALCVKFADNIAKNFATSISILISFLASVYFFDFKVTANFLIGSVIVIGATYLYSRPSPEPVGDYKALEEEQGEELQTRDELKQRA